MRWIKLSIPAALSLAVAACASGGAGRDVAAVVQDEQARQAAAAAVQRGESANDALKAGEAAAARTPLEPPIR